MGDRVPGVPCQSKLLSSCHPPTPSCFLVKLVSFRFRQFWDAFYCLCLDLASSWRHRPWAHAMLSYPAPPAIQVCDCVPCPSKASLDIAPYLFVASKRVPVIDARFVSSRLTARCHAPLRITWTHRRHSFIFMVGGAELSRRIILVKGKPRASRPGRLTKLQC